MTAVEFVLGVLLGAAIGYVSTLVARMPERNDTRSFEKRKREFIAEFLDAPPRVPDALDALWTDDPRPKP